MTAWAIVAALLLVGVVAEWHEGRRRSAVRRVEALEAEQAWAEFEHGRRRWDAPKFQCRCVACGDFFDGDSPLEMLCEAHRPKVPNG